MHYFTRHVPLTSASQLGIKRCRRISEYFGSYPTLGTTYVENNGQYLVQAVVDGEVGEVEAMLLGGVDPNYRSARMKFTPLMIAAEDNKWDIVDLLLRHGACVNTQDELGETALIKAARENHKDVVKLLIDKGAQRDILNYEAMSARDVTLDLDCDNALAHYKSEGENGERRY